MYEASDIRLLKYCRLSQHRAASWFVKNVIMCVTQMQTILKMFHLPEAKLDHHLQNQDKSWGLFGYFHLGLLHCQRPLCWGYCLLALSPGMSCREGMYGQLSKAQIWALAGRDLNYCRTWQCVEAIWWWTVLLQSCIQCATNYASVLNTTY